MHLRIILPLVLLSSYMQDGIAGAVNTNCTCENKLAQIGPKSQHACFFFNEGKRRWKLNVFSEILNIQAPLFWSERMAILFCNMLSAEHWTWQTNSTACLSLINIFCKAFLEHEHLKSENEEHRFNLKYWWHFTKTSENYRQDMWVYLHWRPLHPGN